MADAISLGLLDANNRVSYHTYFVLVQQYFASTNATTSVFFYLRPHPFLTRTGRRLRRRPSPAVSVPAWHPKKTLDSVSIRGSRGGSNHLRTALFTPYCVAYLEQLRRYPARKSYGHPRNKGDHRSLGEKRVRCASTGFSESLGPLPPTLRLC